MLSSLARRVAPRGTRSLSTKKEWWLDIDVSKYGPNELKIWRGPERLGTNDFPRRTGLLALKVGMTHDFNVYGERRPLTILQIEDCFVSQVKTVEKEGYNAVQVAAGPVKMKHIKKPQFGHFEKAKIPIRKHIAEFKVAEKALLPVGTPLTCRHFVPGQYVDVQGTTIGKGFQGVMKKWGFKGQPASHGVSLAHRSIGSIGQCQDPGRVWKGKKMPGRMGGRTKTVQGLIVFKIDTKRNLIYVEGAVPGHAGSYVRIKDAVKKPYKLFNGEKAVLPYPTFSGEEGEEEPEDGIIMQPTPKFNYLDPQNP